MRYAIFSDIHANLEALEAVLAKIDELAQEEPIDQIWFLGDLVGYGPNPNECIAKLRERTDVIIAGNHDWAAINKIDLNDFSEAARISAEWTAEQLTEEHKQFLANLPEKLVIGACTLVHGSPYGPLWEYLTSTLAAEESFKHFHTRFCFVGHTHVPIIFQQPFDVAETPTIPLDDDAQYDSSVQTSQASEREDEEDTVEMVAVMPAQRSEQNTEAASSTDEAPSTEETAASAVSQSDAEQPDEETGTDILTPEEVILSAEEAFDREVEELEFLLQFTRNMLKRVTNEMLIPPEGDWAPPKAYRAIINPGGVGQPRDGDPRAAFMIYDTEQGFTFYRVPYKIEKTQEKIIKAGLPPYLATRLAYGR